MKHDKNKIPYRKGWERLLPLKKRVSRALRRQDLPLLVEMVCCDLVDVNVRLCPMERSPSFSSYSDNGYSLLHMCVLSDHNVLVEKLLKKGADPNIETYFKETPLHHASRRKNLEALCLLVAYGGDPLRHPSKRGHYVDDTPSPKNALQSYEEAMGRFLTMEDIERHILHKHASASVPQKKPISLKKM